MYLPKSLTLKMTISMFAETSENLNILHGVFPTAEVYGHVGFQILTAVTMKSNI
jgi:hypothetical protein